MRYFFEVSYNGKAYSGWQSQANAIGIQSVIEDCLSKILRTKPVNIVGSGRTDAGVHCEQQFFHADFQTSLDTNSVLFRLNSILPKDIVIRQIIPVHENANARYDAISRTYKYKIIRTKNVFTEGLEWFFFKPLDVQTMNDAAALIVGKQDFKSFSKVKTDVSNFVCTISEAYWKEDGVRLEFTISANRFLRGMVRAIVGTLIDVGTGKTSLAEFKEIILRQDRREAGANVPPFGLYLMNVKYPDTIFADK